MVTLYLESANETKSLLHLVQTTIQDEISRLNLALKLADKRLTPFEKKYGVSSEVFMAEMAAEDLQGGDDEYVDWAGEYKLKERLQIKLVQLKNINYGHSNVSQSN